MDRTYRSWIDPSFTCKQKEYRHPAPLLSDDGTLRARGWARHNLFDYDRSLVRHPMRRKEWDFYQISDGRYMVQMVFANISIGGYAQAVLVDLQQQKTLCMQMAPFVGGANKYVLPSKGDVPGKVRMKVGKALFETETFETSRTLHFDMGKVRCDFRMEIAPEQENITTVLPFRGKSDRYFLTTKQNCMPCEGTFCTENESVSFSKDNTFCVMDWGRVCTPYSLVWYWGNGSTWLTDEAGNRHTFGFELTWGIGDESNATETCLFYDGKVHKIGAVDVRTFPKPDGYLKPWRFLSQDGRFRLTMTPFYDHHSDLNVLAMRMHSHQVHGLWNGEVTLDDGTVLTVKDMYAFIEYVENRW